MVVVEPISLAIGAVSLATLFSGCVECFDLIETGRNLGADYELLLVKLSIEKRRLMIWGEATGILRPDQDRDPLLDDPRTYELVERILMNVQKLFGDADALRSKFGLESASPGEASNRTTNGSSICRAVFEDSSFVQFQRRVTSFQRKAGLLTMTKWAIRDSSKFASMIEHLRDLQDGLRHVATSPRTAILKDDLVRREMQSIPNLATLKIIEETCSDPDWKSSASAASLYMQTASYVAPAKRTYIDDWISADRAQQNSSEGETPKRSEALTQSHQIGSHSADMAMKSIRSWTSNQESPRVKQFSRPSLSQTEVMVVCSTTTLVARIHPLKDGFRYFPVADNFQPTPPNRATYSRIMQTIHLPLSYTSIAIYCAPRNRYLHLALCFVQEQLSARGEARPKCHIRFDDRLLDTDTYSDKIPDRMQGYHRDLEKFAESPIAGHQPLADAIDMSWLERRIDAVTLDDYDPASERLDWSTVFRQSKDDKNCMGIVVIGGNEACRSLLQSPPVLPPDNFRGEGRVYRLRELDKPSVGSTCEWKAEHHCNIAIDRKLQEELENDAYGDSYDYESADSLHTN